MYGRTNAGGGGKAFAFIFVTYLVGSVCTATDGSRTLKLKGTRGYGVFYVPYAGTWTVTATDGTEPISQTVEIIAEGQNVSINLKILRLYKYGDEFTAITGGWQAVAWPFASDYTSISTQLLELTKNADNMVFHRANDSDNYSGVLDIVNDIDLTNINTISLLCDYAWTRTSVQYGYIRLILFAIPRSTSYWENAPAQTTIVSSTDSSALSGEASGVTATLDVSSLSGAYDICIGIVSAHGTPTMTATIYEVKLIERDLA